MTATAPFKAGWKRDSVGSSPRSRRLWPFLSTAFHFGEREYRLDFAFPHIKLGIEAHSLRWHMGRERWVRDLQRDRRLKLAGWTLLYFSWDDMKLDPNGVRREIEEARRDLESRLFHETATI